MPDIDCLPGIGTDVSDGAAGGNDRALPSYESRSPEAALVGSGGDPSAQCRALEQENAQLREQVRRLMAAENKLYRLQDQLSAQQRVYVRLAEVGRTLTSLLDVDLIAETVTKFVVYGFNYERCVAFLRDERESQFCVHAFEGYYDADSVARLSSASLSGQEVTLAGMDGDAGFVCYKSEPGCPEADALAQLVMLDEYFAFVLPRKGGGILGFLIAGNTREQARYQTEVVAEGEMLVAFSNLANHTATAVDNVRAFRALERERQLLDQAVADRTRELSEALDIAQEAVRLKAEFLANVSHELRTPLNSIVNVPTALAADYVPVQVLDCASCSAKFQADDSASIGVCPDCGGPLASSDSVACAGDPSEHYRFLKLLQQQGAHLLSLVEDVLDFSRLEAGRMELHLTMVDVAQVMAEVDCTIRGTGRIEQRALVLPEVSSAVTVVADRTKFKQVLINLVGNALKFTKPDGTIEVRVSVESPVGGAGSMLAIDVADNGIGIPADQLDAIFESFRQVDGSHTRAVGGAGLGLAICRQLVQMHGGAISVTSQLGVGSTFRVLWPKDQSAAFTRASSRPPEHLSESTLTVARLGHGCIVVVDDDPVQLSMAGKLLEREGYEVALVARAEEAVETVRRLQPRIVLLDIMMPNVTGLSILTQLKRSPETSSIAIIASTAFHHNRKKAIELGALWLPKPWSSRTLSAAHIESLVGSGLQAGDTAVDDGRHRRPRLVESVSRILYVEDEDANWDVTQLSLRGKFHLKRARDAREAFEILERETFDLILMDIQLGGSDMNGIEICRALTGQTAGPCPEYVKDIRVACPIVFVTAYSSLYSREELLASGGKELVTKPVDFTHLLMLVSRLMLQGALGQPGTN